ncbi:MAG: DUF2207 domain-containing protein, partial [bacterium]|nr:DUF2207 domain-containing protein [bacterium]
LGFGGWGIVGISLGFVCVGVIPYIVLLAIYDPDRQPRYVMTSKGLAEQTKWKAFGNHLKSNAAKTDREFDAYLPYAVALRVENAWIDNHMRRKISEIENGKVVAGQSSLFFRAFRKDREAPRHANSADMFETKKALIDFIASLKFSFGITIVKSSGGAGWAGVGGIGGGPGIGGGGGGGGGSGG